MHELDARRVAAWIREVHNTIQDDEVLTYLIVNAIHCGDLRGDLSEKLIAEYPQYREQLDKKNLLFL